MTSVGLFGLLTPAATKAAAGINNAINFQGRLLNAAGATVPDGTYNLQFKIYQDGAGTAAGDPSGTLLWTESWVGAFGITENRVQVTNGYFSVQLGSICPMNATTCTSGTGNSQTNTVVNFNSDTLWLSVNVGTTSTVSSFAGASGDGEMLPMKRLAANPYAFNAGQLGGVAANKYAQLSVNHDNITADAFTGTNLFQNAVTIQGSAVAFTANASTGAVTIGGLLQATAANTLALDSSVSGAAITIGAANATSISLGHGTIGVTIPASSSLTLGTAGPTSGATGAIIFKNSTNSNILTLQSGVTSGALSYAFTLPTADGTSGQCLQTGGPGGPNPGTLSFSSCTGGASFVNQQLSNLSGAVAINTSLLPGPYSGIGAVGAIDLGSGTLPFGNLYLFGGSSSPTSNNFKLTGTSTHGNETFNLPDITGTNPTSTVCVITGTTQYCPTKLQEAYTNSTGGSTPEILLDSTGVSPHGGLDIQDASSSINANLLNVWASGANLSTGAPLFSVGNTGAVTVQQSAASTTALRVENVNGSAGSVLTADTLNNRIGVNVTYTQMGTAFGTVAHSTTAGVTGATLAAGTYYYKVTAIDSAGGETTPSTETTSQTTTGSTSTITLTWAPIPNASGYRVYRGNSGANSETGFLGTIGTLSGGNIIYTDTGLTVNTASVPSTNTAYYSTNVAPTSTGLANLQVTVGGNGTPTGQLYVSGTVAASALGGLQLQNLGFGIYGLVASGRYLYTTGITNAQTIDASNPAALTSLGAGGTIAGQYSVVAGRYLYGAGGGAAVINIGDTTTVGPTYVGTVSSTVIPAGLAVSGRYAYTVGGTTPGTLQSFDVANPAAPFALTTASINNSPSGIVVIGRYAYITSTNLQIYDISNPSSMSSAGSVSTTGTPNAIAVSGKYAYVLEGTTSGILQIFDISNPASPVSVGSVSTGQTPSKIAVSGRYVYVANSTSTLSLQTFDVSNPTSPVSVGSTTIAAAPIAMTISGRYAYILESGDFIQSFDLGGEYSQSLEAGNTEIGNLTVDNNENILGNSYISGALSVGQSLNIQGNLAVSGTFSPPNASALSEATGCNVATIPGAIYYNTTTATVRTCGQTGVGVSQWTDILTDQDLGLLAYGIVPDSGVNPGDIASVTGVSVNGPCKVSWASSTSVSVTACTAYSGGRKINVAATTVTSLNGNAQWYHLYIDPTTGGITKTTASSTENGNIPTFSATAPLVTIADVLTNGSSVLNKIYDTRVFTTDTKTFASFNGNSTNSSTFNQTATPTVTGAGLGWGVVQTTTSGVVNSASYATAAGIRGVVVATTGTNSPSVVNSIIVTSGPIFIKSVGTSSTNGTIISTTTAGYVGTGTAIGTLYANYGISQLTIATSCSTAAGALTSCQTSQLTDLNIR